MEFMSQGVPAVISRTAIDSYYFDENEVRFCESENAVSFAAGMVEVLTDERLRERLIRNAFKYVAGNHWGSKKQEYLDLVEGLTNGTNVSSRPPGAPWTATTSSLTMGRAPGSGAATSRDGIPKA
jgi:hypothetical protein